MHSANSSKHNFFLKKKKKYTSHFSNARPFYLSIKRKTGVVEPKLHPFFGIQICGVGRYELEGNLHISSFAHSFFSANLQIGGRICEAPHSLLFSSTRVRPLVFKRSKTKSITHSLHVRLGCSIPLLSQRKQRPNFTLFIAKHLLSSG